MGNYLSDLLGMKEKLFKSQKVLTPRLIVLKYFFIKKNTTSSEKVAQRMVKKSLQHIKLNKDPYQNILSIPTVRERQKL